MGSAHGPGRERSRRAAPGGEETGRPEGAEEGRPQATGAAFPAAQAVGLDSRRLVVLDSIWLLTEGFFCFFFGVFVGFLSL